MYKQIIPNETHNWSRPFCPTCSIGTKEFCGENLYKQRCTIHHICGSIMCLTCKLLISQNKKKKVTQICMEIPSPKKKLDLTKPLKILPKFEPDLITTVPLDFTPMKRKKVERSLKLSDDELFNILEYLDFGSILNFACVNYEMYQTIEKIAKNKNPIVIYDPWNMLKAFSKQIYTIKHPRDVDLFMEKKM